MKNLFFYFVLFFLLIVYIYSIVFNAFPISTKIILEAIGFFYCLKYIFNPRFKLKKEYKAIIKIIAVLVLWDIVISFLNGQSEFHLVTYLVPAIGSIFCGQMMYSYTNKHFKKPDTMLKFIVITIFLESVLSILMKFFPPVFDIVSSVLRFEFLTNSSITFDLSRFIGIGNAIFFGVLASCSLGVMTAVYLLNQNRSTLDRFFIIFMWVVISIVSFFSARWSITVIGLSAAMFILNQKGRNLIKTLGLMTGLCVTVGIAYVIVMNNIDYELYEWAIGSLLDPSQSNDHTSENVTNWWLNTHFDIKTLLIGDAQYSLPNGKYYGGSDIGYHRQIFYGGIIGLLLNLWIHYKVLKMTYKYNRFRSFKLYLGALMLGYLAILAKGDATMLTFFILILVYYSQGVFDYSPVKIPTALRKVPNTTGQKAGKNLNV